jgi:3alpha(or 20beta)-hydroxysteroid dehydrogenase
MALLEGKIAIVTGAARGIGLAIARKFVNEGAKVVLTDVLPEAGARAAELGPNAAFLIHDVTKAKRWDEVVAETRSLFGPVSVLVNNAAIPSFAPTGKCTEEHYRRVIEVNQLSVLLGIQAVIETMRQTGGGSIVNTSSTAGLVGAPTSIAYVASKFAVTGMTKAAAIDLGQYGIRVNSVHPGPVATPMLKDAQAAGLNFSSFNGTFPMARLAEPRELAGIYAFLASDESSFCTGACFVVDGGVTAA